MKSCVLLAVMAFISLHSVYAQSDFRPGYVVLNNGDTLNGLIDFRGRISRIIRCTFKENKQAPNQVFNPDEAIAYRYTDGKYFVSREVNLDGEIYRLFLEYLFNGIVDVFYFGGGPTGHNYLVESKDTMYELKIVREIVQGPSNESYKQYLKIDKEYIDVLKSIFSDSPTVMNKIDKVSLRHKDLIQISTDYHNEMCTDEQPYIIYEKKLPTVISKYGLLAGLGFNRMMVDYNSYYTFNNNFNNPVIPALGLFLSLNFPYVSDWANIVYEGMYLQRDLQATHTNSYLYEFVDTDFTLSQQVWYSSLMAKYRFPGLGLRPSFQVGGFYNRFFNNRFHGNSDVFTSEGYYKYSLESSEYPFRRYDTGICMGAGLANRKWFIDLRYNFGFGMHHNMLTNINTQAVQLNVGYSLN